MNLNKNAEIFLPSGKEQKIDRLCIAAHQDDIEFMAFQGIFECLQRGEVFGGVVVSNGSGSPRTGKYQNITDEQMMELRRSEQKEAAVLGGYGVQILLNHISADIKNGADQKVVCDLNQILNKYRPKIVYTHNLADKHDTHIGSALKTIEAIRQMDKAHRPQKLFGCEVWRALDWVNDQEKVVCDVSEGRELALKLMRVFRSQIEGGKRYDLATDGRRYANATYGQSHETDKCTQAIYAIDMTPLICDDNADIAQFIDGFIQRMRSDVLDRISRILS